MSRRRLYSSDAHHAFEEDYGDFMVGASGDLRRPVSEVKLIDSVIEDIAARRFGVAVNKLRILRRQASAGFHKNPPGGEETRFGNRVLAVEYIHTANGQPYRHEFGKGVEIFANPDGSVRIAHPSRRVWEEFR